MQADNGSAVVSFRLENPRYQRLKELARGRKMSMGEYCAAVLRVHVERIQDQDRQLHSVAGCATCYVFFGTSQQSEVKHHEALGHFVVRF